MALETATYIDGLVAANPTSTDPVSQGDDHLRLLKSTVKATFPNLSGAVTPTHTELNYVDGVTSAIQTQLDAKVPTNGALGTPSSGSLTNCTADGTNAVGFKNVPQNSKSAAYTLVAGDAGCHIFHPSADTTARTWTIPSNASVAYPIGTVLTFVNQNSAGTITISITTDTIRLAGAGTTGNRTLSANGIATAIKVTSTEWLISGTGLT
jgi:hypothetical protein